jgi:Ca2+/Na+ antiporter
MALTDTPNEPEPRPDSPLRKALVLMSVTLIVAALYVAYIFYSRYESNRQAQRALDAKKQEAQKKSAEQIFGSGEIRFTTFSASDGLLKRGKTTELCYGVINAASVKLDPPVEETKPSYHHCLEIAPKKTTRYTITATDRAGHTKSESLEVRVE